MTLRPYPGELIGPFVLVSGGCGSAVLAGGHIGFAGVAAPSGLSLLAMIYTVGPISGSHLNPAVTLGMVLSRKFDARRAASARRCSQGPTRSGSCGFSS